MSNFEKKVLRMRAAQIAYNENPNGENLLAVEDAEFEVDEALEFLQNCKGYTFKEVKEYLESRTL